MVTPNCEFEEMKSLTQLVLYGWGYPMVFNHPITNHPFQNRLVRFSLQDSPSIEGISQLELRKFLPKLVMIQENYLDFLERKQSESKNPYVFISVDTPKPLLTQEQINLRKQFEDWAKTKTAYPNSGNWQTEFHFWTDDIKHLKTHRFTIGLKRIAIAIVVLTAITLTIISVLAMPAVGCSSGEANGLHVSDCRSQPPTAYYHSGF